MSPLTDLAAVSRFAARVLHAQPELASELAAPQAFTRSEMSDALAGATADAEGVFRRRLRRLRTRVFLRVMARDILAQAPLEEICSTMSELAAAVLEASLAWLGAAELVVVGMGKLGGR